MAVSFKVASNKLGAVLHCSGETAYLLTDLEVEEARKQILSDLDAATAEAKAAIRLERKKGAYE